MALMHVNHGLDNDRQVFFYEQEFYVLSNFSSFRLWWKGQYFPTSEHAYHWEKFSGKSNYQKYILEASSAHDAFKLAQYWSDLVRPDWNDVKVDIMRDILRAKVQQHEYVCKKLLETGDREIIENSWRDGFWGWGPYENGSNVLGKLWMEIRQELKKDKI